MGKVVVCVFVGALLYVCFCCFFVTETATTEIYTYGHTLSLHDALPIGRRWWNAWWSYSAPDRGHGDCPHASKRRSYLGLSQRWRPAGRYPPPDGTDRCLGGAERYCR